MWNFIDFHFKKLSRDSKIDFSSGHLTLNFEEGTNIVLYLIYYRDFKDIETKQKFIVELV